jgi:hypothetical protein
LAAEPAPTPQTDHNLAEMAQQLEAALRRAPMPEGRPPVTDPLAAPPHAKAGTPTRELKTRVEPTFGAKPEPKVEPAVEAKPEPKSEPGPGRKLYDNLEEEMASLLGRPPGKS